MCGRSRECFNKERPGPLGLSGKQASSRKAAAKAVSAGGKAATGQSVPGSRNLQVLPDQTRAQVFERDGKRGGRSSSDESKHWLGKTHRETTPRRCETIGKLAGKEAREKPRGFADSRWRSEKLRQTTDHGGLGRSNTLQVSDTANCPTMNSSTGAVRFEHGSPSSGESGFRAKARHERKPLAGSDAGPSVSIVQEESRRGQNLVAFGFVPEATLFLPPRRNAVAE